MTSGLRPLGPSLALALERMMAQGEAPGLSALGYGTTCFSAGLLSRLAEALRQRLDVVFSSLQQGFTPEQPGIKGLPRVAFLLPSHPVFVVSWLAALAQGVLAIPLNPLLTPHELTAQLLLARPHGLLTHPLTRGRTQAMLSTLKKLAPQVPPPQVLELDLPHETVLSTETVLPTVPERPLASASTHPFERLLAHELGASAEQDPPSWPVFSLQPSVSPLKARPLSANLPALVLFTSGTTGQPKGLVHSQGSLEHNARTIAADWLGGVLGEVPSPPLPGRLTGAQRHHMLGALPLCHNFGLNVTLNATLLHGGLLELLPMPSIRLLKEAVTGELRGRLASEPAQAEGVTVLPLTPPLFRSLLLALPEGAGARMHLAVSGGAALPGALRNQLQARFPSLALRDTYGLTEASLVACSRPGTMAHPGWGKPGTVGRPIQDVRLLLVDDVGQPVPSGVPGEITVSGPSLACGVLEPAASSGVEADISPGLRTFDQSFYPTGDIGVLDTDGDLTLLDRKKDLILHGGQNVYPQEVEEVLYQHPMVQEALVFGAPDVRMGEKVVAAVRLSTPPGEKPLDSEALRVFCRRFLSAYKVPTEIRVQDALPRGSTGKLLRRALKDEWLARHGSEPPRPPK